MTADSRKRVGWNPSKMDQSENSFFYYNYLVNSCLHLQASRECKFTRNAQIGEKLAAGRHRQQA
jgi:hypothetical protein